MHAACSPLPISDNDPVSFLAGFSPQLTMANGGPSFAIMMRNLGLILSLVLLQVKAEIVPLSIVLDASSAEVHYIRGWLEAPATIDMSSVQLITSVDPDWSDLDDYPSDFYDDDADDDADDDDSASGSGSGSDSGNGDIPSGSDNGDDGSSPTQSPSQASENGDFSDSGSGSGGNGSDGGEPTVSPTIASGSDAGDSATDSPTKAPHSSGNKHTSAPHHGGAHNGNNGGGAHNGSNPTQAPSVSLNRRLQSQRANQVIDFVLFMIPENCKKDMWGECDWTTLGIGADDDYVDGDVSYCCSKETVDRDVCEKKDIGKLIIDPTRFDGERRSVQVPNVANKEFKLDDKMFEIQVTGDYVLLMGNCYDDGMDVIEVGTMEWRSAKGYLPGDIYGLMLFYSCLSAFYFVLYIWYSFGMRLFQESAIPIQKYIVSTIFIGLLELTCRAIDLGYWNLDGMRSDMLVYASLGLGVLKDGLSRVLGVMVAKGWGIVRESLGRSMIKIIFLGLIYTGLVGFRDFSLVIAAEDVKKLSVSTEEELVDFALILEPLIAVINLIFYFWILNSLNATADYLSNMNQTTKLRRHMRLRRLMLISMTIAFVWLTFTVLNVLMGGILNGDQLWVMEALMHLNYIIILSGVAVLWRPNANAKDYAMQMQIPTGGDDENDLELSCVVPSANSMEDGNDPDHANGIQANYGRFS